MKVKAFTLSTCPYCRAFKKFMNDNHLALEYTDVDLLDGDERNRAIKEAYSYCEGCGFPIIVIDENTVIEGFDEPKLREIFKL